MMGDKDKRAQHRKVQDTLMMDAIRHTHRGPRQYTRKGQSRKEATKKPIRNSSFSFLRKPRIKSQKRARRETDRASIIGLETGTEAPLEQGR
jgi:hypothetical protein